MQTFEAKEQDAVYTNGSTGPVNVKEVTKIREVVFEKHPSEPLVLSCVQFQDLTTGLDGVVHQTHISFVFLFSSVSPQGVTLKLNEKQKCMVARILHGGMIHRQGECCLD